MKSYKVKVNGHNIQVSDYPGGEKGTIIGIHGLTGNRLQLRYYAEYFSPEYRVITLDVRGRGNSDDGETQSSIFEHTKDVHGLIDELNIENPILMGYSMGAFVATIVASQNRSVQKVILLDGAATMSEHQRPIVEPSLGRLSKHFESKEDYVQQVSDSYENLGITKGPKLTEVLEYEIEDHGNYWENKASESTIRKDWESFWEFDVEQYAPAIDVPVLLVQCSGGIGANPPLFLPEHYERTIATIKNIEVMVSDSNHYTMVFENRDEINNAITTFLKR